MQPHEGLRGFLRWLLHGSPWQWLQALLAVLLLLALLRAAG